MYCSCWRMIATEETYHPKGRMTTLGCSGRTTLRREQCGIITQTIAKQRLRKQISTEKLLSSREHYNCTVENWLITAIADSYKPLDLTYWENACNCCLVAKAWRHCWRGYVTPPPHASSKVFTAVAWQHEVRRCDANSDSFTARLGSARIGYPRHSTENTASSTIAQ
jgi:hypothetical protein